MGLVLPVRPLQPVHVFEALDLKTRSLCTFMSSRPELLVSIMFLHVLKSLVEPAMVRLGGFTVFRRVFVAVGFERA